MRHNHNLPEYVTFVDIVKAFDTVNHDLLMEIFERCGAQPKLISSIIKMYKDPKNVLKIGKIRKYIEQTVGVRQGDWMAPVLSLLLVMEFVEILEE